MWRPCQHLELTVILKPFSCSAATGIRQYYNIEVRGTEIQKIRNDHKENVVHQPGPPSSVAPWLGSDAPVSTVGGFDGEHFKTLVL